MHIATASGFAPVDGAISAYYGAMGASANENKIVVTVDNLWVAKPLDYSSGKRMSGWWLIGPIYAFIQSMLYMFVNSGEDRLAQARQLGAIELPCNAADARKEMQKLYGKEYPDGAQFSKYTTQVVKDVFDYQYASIRKKIESSEEYDLQSYAKDGMIICVASGGAYAIDELAGISALCDLVVEQMKPEERKKKKGIINLITGTSAGSLNALYVSQIHDKVFQLGKQNKRSKDSEDKA